MEQEQVPDLHTVAAWLAEFYESLRSLRLSTAAPEHYSVDPDLIRPWCQHLDDRRTDMLGQLAWFRRLMEEENQVADYIPELSLPQGISPENAIYRFQESDAPLGQRLAQVEQSFLGLFDITAGLLQDAMGRYDTDVALVAQATETANHGEYKRASDIMGGASRIFKNVAYWQPDRQASKMASTLETIRKDFALRQRKVDELTQGLEDKSTLRNNAAAGEARAIISDAAGELLKARKGFPDVDAKSPFALELGEMETLIIPWQGEQAARLDAADRSSQTFKRKLIIAGSVATGVLVLVALGLLWWNTGYRLVDPNGKIHTARFALPGTHEVTFQVDGFRPYTAKVPVSFGRYNDRGQISRDKMQPFTSVARLDARPAGASYELRATAGRAAPRRGTLPAELADLPVGDYELTLTLGDHIETQSLTIERDTPLEQTITLQTGGLRLSTEPSGAEVDIDGQPTGVTPLTIPALAPGAHTARLTVEGSTITLPFTVTAGEVTVLEHAVGYGGLKLATDPPGAQITFLDAPGLAPGNAPLQRDRLVARDYLVKVEFPELDPKEFTVTVAPEATTEKTLELDYARLILDAEPVIGTRLAVTGLPADHFSGKAPLDLPPLKPGTYQIVAESASDQTMTREITATSDMRGEKITFEFANGSLRLTSDPPGINVSIPALGIYNQNTPVELASVVTGDYTATFHQGEGQIRRKFSVEKNQTTEVAANFLDVSLKDRTDLTATDPRRFTQDRTITPGVGLAHARLGQPLEEALTNYGKPNSIRRVPDPELGSRFILNYSKMGLTLISDGNTIDSINFTQVPTTDPNRPPGAYWARTDQRATIGDDENRIRRAHGEPLASSSRQIEYDGMTFFLRSGEVIGIRITEPKDSPPAPAANAPGAEPG
ncbi:MAG: PEGA domain-containing protein [Verrucomicrobiota bacterium]